MTVTINGTTGVAGVDGTAATPAIQGNDTNTGIFFPAADTIAFAEGGAEVARFDSSGNLGIGTSSPLAKLSVGSGSLSDANVPIQINSTTSGEAYLGANKAGGYGALFGYANGAGVGTGVAIRAIQSADPIMFFTNSNAERMRIDSSGSLLVGTANTDPIASSTNGLAYAISNTVLRLMSSATALALGSSNNTEIQQFYRSSKVGSISVTASATAYNTSSDYRLKENIAPMTGALDLVQQLKPVTYNWKVDGSSGQGFIAHELQEVVPDCVSGEKDAVETYTDEDGVEQTRPKYQGIDTSFLVATLTAAIQEQQAIITDLKARIETLEAK